MEVQILRWHLWEISGAVCTCLHHQVPRLVHCLHLTLQHDHEGGVPVFVLRHCVPHLHALQKLVRLRERHVSCRVPVGASHRAVLPGKLCLQPTGDLVDLLHLPGGGGHNAAALHDHKDRRGRVHHHPLLVLPRTVQSPLHRQLGVALPHRGLLRPDRRGVWRRADHLLLRFLLPLRHKGASRKSKDEPADARLKQTSVLFILPSVPATAQHLDADLALQLYMYLAMGLMV